MTENILPRNEILKGNCIEILDRLPEKSVDLIFADPPYNLQLQRELWRPDMSKVDAVDDDWDHFGDMESYDRFTRAWLAGCRRVLKENGTIWVIGTYHNIYRVGCVMQDLGFWFLNDVIWIKTNPMPNFRGVRFTNAHETLIWASHHKGARYTFNHHAMKAFNEGKQMRSDWLLPICTGSERLRMNGRKAHSTQKPEALLERVILSSSREGDLVLDPFFGSGTTGVVAKRLRRDWLGIERDEEYVRLAGLRLQDTVPASPGSIPLDERDQKRRLPRLSFKKLVERGELHTGQTLYFDRQPGCTAQITPDGRLLYQNMTGSIHQIGKHLSGEHSCNGWEHWYFEAAAGNLQSINVLRRKLQVAADSNDTQD